MSFYISLSNLEQVKTFVALAARQPFDVRVGNERQNISARHLLGMFSLDFSRPLQVQAECSDAEFAVFRQDVLALGNSI